MATARLPARLVRHCQVDVPSEHVRFPQTVSFSERAILPHQKPVVPSCSPFWIVRGGRISGPRQPLLHLLHQQCVFNFSPSIHFFFESSAKALVPRFWAEMEVPLVETKALAPSVAPSLPSYPLSLEVGESAKNGDERLGKRNAETARITIFATECRHRDGQQSG
jgi:hypothetical protein